MGTGHTVSLPMAESAWETMNKQHHGVAAMSLAGYLLENVDLRLRMTRTQIHTLEVVFRESLALYVD
jgi:hypothetical protein